MELLFDQDDCRRLVLNRHGLDAGARVVEIDLPGRQILGRQRIAFPLLFGCLPGVPAILQAPCPGGVRCGAGDPVLRIALAFARPSDAMSATDPGQFM